MSNAKLAPPPHHLLVLLQVHTDTLATPRDNHGTTAFAPLIFHLISRFDRPNAMPSLLNLFIGMIHLRPSSPLCASAVRFIPCRRQLTNHLEKTPRINHTLANR